MQVQKASPLRRLDGVFYLAIHLETLLGHHDTCTSKRRTVEEKYNPTVSANSASYFIHSSMYLTPGPLALEAVFILFTLAFPVQSKTENFCIYHV